MGEGDTKYDAERTRSRAAVLCAMDCIMHHLNDECDIEAWLVLGVPDGGPFDVMDGTDPAERLDYYGSFTDDETFEDNVKLFARIVKRVCLKGKEYLPHGFS